MLGGSGWAPEGIGKPTLQLRERFRYFLPELLRTVKMHLLGSIFCEHVFSMIFVMVLNATVCISQEMCEVD